MRSAQELAAARSIWPTGTTGRPISADMVAVRVAAVRAYLACGWDLESVRRIHPRAVEVFEHSQRTRGIAEGRRLARARRERFRSWLYTYYQDRAARRVDDYASPEAALCDPEVVEAVCRLIGGDWFERYLWEDYRPLARRLRKSKRWAALPWQREGGR